MLEVSLLVSKNDYDGLLDRLSAFDSYINLHGNETLYNMLVWGQEFI